MSARILLVDDDRFLLANVRQLLQAQGFQVSEATNAADALGQIAKCAPDLAILDVNLPDMDGISILRRIRGKWRFPVLMLTARSESTDKVVGLEVGADDYLTKPFDPMELLARVRAMLRRAQEYGGVREGTECLQIGDLVIDQGLRDAVVAGKPARLTQKEFMLLHHLATNAGRVVPRDSLFERNWGYDIEFSSNSLDVHIYRLRKKIEADPEHPRYLHTVKGYGYKLDDAPSSR